MTRCSPRSLAALAALLALGGAAGCGSGERAPRTTAEVRAEGAPAKSAARARPVGNDDAEADKAFATSREDLTEKAPAPGAAKASASRAKPSASGDDDSISPGAPSDEQIAQELKQMDAVIKAQKKAGGGAGRLTLESDGTATVPAGAPAVIARVVAGANAIAKFPYVYGGGHGSFVDTAYDCSGSLSYALAAGGLLKAPIVSGDFAKTGEEGPGKWITIYANAGHTFMVVGGLRYDTSGRGGPLGTRWQAAPRGVAGFEVRHPPGL